MPKDKPPVSMRIRLKYPDVETFIEKYAANISRGGMFIQSRAPQLVGTVLRFEVLLQEGTSLLKGEGVVIWVKEYDAAHPTRVHGMGVRFAELDEASAAMVELVLAAKVETGAPLAPHPSQTQEVRALVREAETAEEEPEASIGDGPVTAQFAPALDVEAAVVPEGISGFTPLGRRGQAAAPGTAALPLLEVVDTRPYGPATAFAPAGTAATPDGPATRRIAQPSSPTPPAPTAALVGSRELAVLERVLETGGDGVAVALAMAEEVLAELIAGAGLAEEQIAAARRTAGERVSGGGDGELEALLAPTPLPLVDVEHALQALRALGAAPIPAVAQVKRSLPPSTELAQLVTPAALSVPVVTPFPGEAAAGAASVNAIAGERAAGAASVNPVVALAPTAPAQASGPAAPAIAALASVALPLTAAAPAPDPASGPPSAESLEDREQFDPSLLHAAARTARAARQTLSEQAFDLSDNTTEPVTSEVFRGGLDQPAPAGGAPDQGWKGLQTATELLDHGSDRILQDMAQLAGQPPAEPRPPAETRRSRGRRGGRPALRDEPEERATEPVVPARDESADDLSLEVWREVVGDAAQEVDTTSPLPATATDDDDDSFFEGQIPELDTDLDVAEEPGEADLGVAEDLDTGQPDDAGLGHADDLLAAALAKPFGEPGEPGENTDVIPGARGNLFSDSDLGALDDLGDEGEHTVVTAMPSFESVRVGRAATFLEEERDLPGQEPDSLPPDPDLDGEVFEALAGLRDTLREPGAEPDELGSDTAPSADELLSLAGEREPIPSLEALAGQTDEAPGEDQPELDGAVDLTADPEPLSAEEKQQLKPRKSGIFRRIFGKKE